MAERDMGVRLGEVTGGLFTPTGTRATIALPDGDPERWRQVFLTRMSQPEEDAYLERGPRSGEPDFSDLGPQSPLDALRAWGLAHYKSSGITAIESINTLLEARGAQFQVFVTQDLFGRVADRNKDIIQPMKVRAYAKALRAGTLFPPLVLWQNGKLRLLEGFHRLYAAVEVPVPSVAGVVFSGSK